MEEGQSRRIEKVGLETVVVPLLELARAFGPLAAQALLLSQPLLDGLVDREALTRIADWLDNPQRAGMVLDELEMGRGKS